MDLNLVRLRLWIDAVKPVLFLLLFFFFFLKRSLTGCSSVHLIICIRLYICGWERFQTVLNTKFKFAFS